MIEKKAIEFYGLGNQISKAIEELAELIVALSHYREGRGTGDVIEELADVEIMIEQIKIGLNIYGEVKSYKTKKLSALRDRLRKE